jgi:hypothetical protein
MKFWRFFPLMIPMMVALILTVAWANRYLFIKIRFKRDFFQTSPGKLIKENEKFIQEDQKILSQYELFFPSSGTKDAGPFLNPMVHWQIGEIHHLGILTLPEFIHRELNFDWVMKKPLFKKMGLNFGWMKELLKYDVWSPEFQSPAYPPGKKYRTYSYPIPNYKDLISWAKLRYLYGKETDDVQNALKEVRHLMRLIWTNDYIYSTMTVVNMLKAENQFEEVLTPREMGNWHFIPRDHVMRAKRYFYSMSALVDIRLPDELFDQSVKLNLGICPMISEGMLNHMSLKDFLGEELRYAMYRMNRVIKASHCRRSIIHKIWSEPKEESNTTLDGLKILGKQVTFEELERSSDLKAAVGYQIGAKGANPYFHYGK